MWALREVPNETTGVAPYLLVYRCLPRRPSAILRKTWLGDREIPLGFGKSAKQFLTEIKENLHMAQKCAEEHTKVALERYVHYHNLWTREKLLEGKIVLLECQTAPPVVYSVDSMVQQGQLK
jgi:hypothetical protein